MLLSSAKVIYVGKQKAKGELKLPNLFFIFFINLFLWKEKALAFLRIKKQHSGDFLQK